MNQDTHKAVDTRSVTRALQDERFIEAGDGRHGYFTWADPTGSVFVTDTEPLPGVIYVYADALRRAGFRTKVVRLAHDQGWAVKVKNWDLPE